MLGMTEKKQAKKTSKDRGPALFVRIDDDTEAALQDFIGAQDVPPDRQAVGLKALHEFLAKRGHWPRKPTPPK